MSDGWLCTGILKLYYCSGILLHRKSELLVRAEDKGCIDLFVLYNVALPCHSGLRENVRCPCSLLPRESQLPFAGVFHYCDILCTSMTAVASTYMCVLLYWYE